jgi:outer membrane protein OmpA-like peptidoglycan-associated protein
VIASLKPHRRNAMGHVRLVMLALFASSACGGVQSAEPASSPSALDGLTEGQAPENSAEPTPPDNEFQVQHSDDAGEARGEHPSEIEATETHAAMRMFVVNPDTGPISGIVIKLTGPDGTSYYTGETDAQGYGEVLVPIGQRYAIEYLSLGRRNSQASVEVPREPNHDLRLTMRYRRIRPEQEQTPPRFVLDGVLFASGRAALDPESFPRLDRVVEYMTHRPNVRIRVTGHTDNRGDPQRNQALSEARARAVRQYLVSQGIAGNRIEAVGYGDQEPIASNDTESGRQQNRRIVATEL